MSNMQLLNQNSLTSDPIFLLIKHLPGAYSRQQQPKVLTPVMN